MERIEKDTDRDFFMTAEQAKEYGIVDEVISSKPDHRGGRDRGGGRRRSRSRTASMARTREGERRA